MIYIYFFIKKANLVSQRGPAALLDEKIVQQKKPGALSPRLMALIRDRTKQLAETTNQPQQTVIDVDMEMVVWLFCYFFFLSGQG